MNENNDIQTPDILKDQYTFIRLLGEGTSGKTWLAKRNCDNLKVAIKVMKFALAENFKSYELFCREAQVMKSLNIPGVPKVFECQAGDAASLSFIIQEYIEFPSLQTIMKQRGKLDENQTIRILEKLGEIIYQLQANYVPPVIHRDIKPSNVLCDLSTDDPKVSLIDFGAVANPQKRSEKSTVAGTFGYMAPEQMLNDVVIQSDYYAIGALAAHLLTGIEPYEMDSQNNAFELDYMGAIQTHAPKTSKAMKMLIGHLLDPVASNRPINATDLLNEIQRVKHNELPLQADNNNRSSMSVPRRVWIWIKNHLPRISKWVNIPEEKWTAWPTAEGIIYVKTKINNVCKAEYTFDANDRTWCGMAELVSEDIKPPHPCTVRYNPDDPRFNIIEKV